MAVSSADSLIIVLSPEAVLADESEEEEDTRGESSAANSEQSSLHFVGDGDHARLLGNALCDIPCVAEE